MNQHNETNVLQEKPVNDFIDDLIGMAYHENYSDIHLEPFTDIYRIRIRKNGLLNVIASISFKFGERLIASIKVLAKLNIAERRIPQDGQLTLPFLKFLHLRFSSFPTLHGEKIVLRLLKKNQQLFIDNLGLIPSQQSLLRKKLDQPQQLILFTGPTGCGKTSTLYAALNYLNNHKKNICTVEDPVEIHLEGINQSNINSKINLNFPQLLRAILRQDPDVIMIGEIRDEATSSIAIQAAQTGHLVLATLHSTTAYNAMQRLSSLSPNLTELKQAISLIVGQRLVRVLCSYCKLKQNDFFVANKIGCSSCHEGYYQRIGVFELVELNQNLKQPYTCTIKPIFSLQEACAHLLKSGLTSSEELTRVIGE